MMERSWYDDVLPLLIDEPSVFIELGAKLLEANEDLFEYDGVPSMIADVFPELNTAERLRAEAFSKSRYVHQSGCEHMMGSMFMD
jgi:hypothetical protein